MGNVGLKLGGDGMNAAHGSTNLAILMLAALAAGWSTAGRPLAAQDQAATAPADLKWTPHRASLPPSEPSAKVPEEAEYTPPPEQTFDRQPLPPATVSLPDGVPPAGPVRREIVFTPQRPAPPRRDIRPPAAMSGTIGQLYDPTSPDSVLGFKILRTPRGTASRPIFAPEGRQAIAMQAAADRAAVDGDRLGGGLAPRYVGGRAAATNRPERLAMNVDGIPSVMTQAPQVGGLDDAAVPGRTPPGAGSGGSRLPSPSAGTAEPPPATVESIGPGIEMPDDYGPVYGVEGAPDAAMMGETEGMAGGLLMGEYPTQLHVESFYDDPYACDDEEGFLPICQHHGRICAWLRRFGRPYYGWRWYRDFTASAGITGFTNATDFGINGNFGTNEYLNWAMPFWNAFGVGWQVGWRGVQSNFQPATIEIGNRTLSKNARDQNFLTTGFFTRAFEGRGLQGGIVYDYLHDSWFENTDLAQLRYELSYVWGYHEWGFWGASNITDQIGLFGHRRRQQPTGVADTLSLYTGFYRLQFGDANEWKVWAGGTSEADGIIGTLVRAPMHKSLALEGTFTYVIPGRNQVIDLDRGGALTTFSPAAWNVSVNVVWYPAARSRRSLSSPYRPLFEVADNGSMIRSVESLQP
jgi:hypothetical protein